MERWSGRVALVTGASTGIGEAFCRALVKHGMTVVGCARRVELIEKTAKELEGETGRLIPMKCDLTVKSEIESMFRAIKDQVGGVDVCVNNAAYLSTQQLLVGDTDTFQKMLDTNIMGLSIVTQMAVQSMKERKVDDGHIIHISSITGHRYCREIAAMHFYSTTKHAVKCLTEGLRACLRAEESMIRVSTISPAVVDTVMARKWVEAEFGKEKMEQLFRRRQCLLPEEVADNLIYILSAPPSVNIRDICMSGVLDPL
ncbi:dehydrogenase/reductase SDR family member 11-like [Lingula anatina]|uniref:Dehydrogenase/reductase SDR family member 11-like n=1 Tax=Lingula anatina TaxID=7574 RepID=A0A1S3HUM6_LINAN|nr:dehydrogenase/reductase SDR family member 11-like [Lingula anatina]|eukprot:XP_013389745.1 dehydrogenase/reductase SDR family member 11-like [Lingula anatina]